MKTQFDKFIDTTGLEVAIEGFFPEVGFCCVWIGHANQMAAGPVPRLTSDQARRAAAALIAFADDADARKNPFSGEWPRFRVGTGHPWEAWHGDEIEVVDENEDGTCVCVRGSWSSQHFAPVDLEPLNEAAKHMAEMYGWKRTS